MGGVVAEARGVAPSLSCFRKGAKSRFLALSLSRFGGRLVLPPNGPGAVPPLPRPGQACRVVLLPRRLLELAREAVWWLLEGVNQELVLLIDGGLAGL